MEDAAATEIRALVRVVDELDYYEVLHLPRDAPASEVRTAYHAASQRFHPDAHRLREADLRGATATISKRVCEAYSVLRDPRRRRVYDDLLKQGGATRIPLGDIEEQATRRKRASQGGTTRQGQQFFGRAIADMRREDWAAAARNLRTALAFEPSNTDFQRRLEDAQARRSP